MPDQLLDLMLKAARAAAAEIMEVYLDEFDVYHKIDGSPVTLADHKAEKVILKTLEETGMPFLAEESVAGGHVPELGDRFFCIDPLDGTKEFLKRNGEFTVNIALIEKGRPTHGVILAPASGATYLGSPQGAFEINFRNDLVPIRTNPNPPMHVVASRSHKAGPIKDFCEAFLVAKDVSVGSSLKFCLLAKGEAQLYPRFTPTSEWDTAAGQAILEAAGGAVLVLDGGPLTYGRGGDHLNPFFVAAASPELAAKAAAEMQKALSDG
jgi:3'(2'), 5'-bisphosphate nucleotidase